MYHLIILLSLFAFISPGIQESTYVPPGVIDDIIRKLEAQVSNSINVLNNILESEDLNPKMLSFDTFQMLTEDSAEIKQNWENMYPIIIEEFKCQVLFLKCYYCTCVATNSLGISFLDTLRSSKVSLTKRRISQSEASYYASKRIILQA